MNSEKVVFSFQTALFLLGLSDRVPNTVTQVRTALGNSVKCYDRERTICNIVSDRQNIDKQIYADAIVKYFNSKEKNIRNLIKYSRQLGIEHDIRNYIEVL